MLPCIKRPLERWEPPVPREMPEHIKLGESSDFTQSLKRLLASPNICGKRWVWQQYDHMVQTNTVEGPGAGDAGVIRIKGSQRGLAMALDGNRRWCYLDPGWARCTLLPRRRAKSLARARLLWARRIA